MGVVVMKFGGSSVADAEKINNVARIALAEKERGNDVVVAVSAMGKTTDGLVALAKQITDRPHPREMDMLLSTGEQVSIACLAMALHEMGSDAVSFTGPQVRMRTDEAHGRAKILEIDEDDMTVWVQSGVLNVELQTEVEKRGLFFPPDPASMNFSTIGGNAAENAGRN